MKKLVILLLLLALPLWAQDKRKQAFDLVDRNQLVEALPLLEELAAANPRDGEVQLKLGFCRLVHANTQTEPGIRKRERARAREALETARRLGVTDSLLTAALEGLGPDGGEEPLYSENKAAQAVMVRAEADFNAGRYSQARAAYAEALELDPRLYHAVLATGQCYRLEGKPELEMACYARALAINPYGEAAYRYWGKALMKAGQEEAALEKYIEGYLVQPYGPLSRDGLIEFARSKGLKLEHAIVRIPTAVNGNTIEITSDAGAAWLSYSLARTLWRQEKWPKLHPGEAYRPSLEEEADAIRMALAVAEESGQKPDASLATLQKLEQKGLLEAFILLGMPGEGIVDDYAAYYRAHRDLLIRYVREVVLQGGRV